MKVTKIIFSSDDSHYLDFWKINSEITLKKLGVTPVLFHITDEDSDFFEDEFGLVKKVKKLDWCSTSFQSQIIRMFATKFFPDEVCMTSDIDMILFNKSYLENNISSINDDNDLVILNSDAYDDKRPECVGMYSGNRYPICYVIGKGKTFEEIIKNNVTFEEYCHRLFDRNQSWDTYELYFGEMLSINKSIKVHKIKRGYSSNFHAPQRIEKYMFNGSNEFYKLNLNGYIDINSFIDCHCKGPYSENKYLIDKIKNMILND